MIARRPPSIFRGSEFVRLLALLALMVVGWPLVMFYTFSKKDVEAPPEPPRADAPPLPPADPAIELAGVEDKTPPNPRDNPGYRLLFDRARAARPETLDAEARRDVVFSQLLQRPTRYRGLPIHLDLTARRILVQDDIAPELTPKRRFYEAWAFSKDSQAYPYVLAFEEAPADLPIGDAVFARITFDGYFFKIISYQDGKGTARKAPLLIGRLVAYRAPTTKPATGLGLPSTYVVLGLATVYLLFRVAGAVLRRRPSVARLAGGRPSDRIEPEALSAWIESGGSSSSAPGDEAPPPPPMMR